MCRDPGRPSGSDGWRRSWRSWARGSSRAWPATTPVASRPTRSWAPPRATRCCGCSPSRRSSWPWSRRWPRGWAPSRARACRTSSATASVSAGRCSRWRVLLLANLANTVAEFAGASAALGLFGIPTVVTVPVLAVGLWLVVMYASYRRLEKLFLLLSLVFVTYVAAAVLAHPDWSGVAHGPDPPVAQRAGHGHRRGAAAGRGHGRHHHHALHAVLPPVGRGREGHRRGGPGLRACGRGRRVGLDQRHRVLHRARDRGRAVRLAASCSTTRPMPPSPCDRWRATSRP